MAQGRSTKLISWIRTSGLSIQNSLSQVIEETAGKFGGDTMVVEAVCNLFVKAIKQSRQEGYSSSSSLLLSSLALSGTTIYEP